VRIDVLVGEAAARRRAPPNVAPRGDPHQRAAGAARGRARTLARDLPLAPAMTTSTKKARPTTSRSRAAERARREPPRPSAAALLATAAAGVGVLVATGLARTGRPPAAPLDRLVRRGFRARWPDRVPKDAWWLGGRRHTRGHAVSEAIGGLTGELATIGAGAAAALAVHVGRRRADDHRPVAGLTPVPGGALVTVGGAFR
jgi:hypothetical protein